LKTTKTKSCMHYRPLGRTGWNKQMNIGFFAIIFER